MDIAGAVEALRRGDLVVLPTETVYGLGADALNPVAVAKIFEAKGRPSDNPLIVHVADVDAVLRVAAPADDRWRILAARFWPGPLTLVLPKRPEVPDITTAGLSSVAVRIPDHPAMLAVLRDFGGGVAAPSANPFMGVSPTRVEMLAPSILRAAMVLDGGACRVGIESTVLDLTGPVARILRPGDISAAQIAAALGTMVEVGPDSSERASPGLYPRHYAPTTPLSLVESLGDRPGLGFDAPRHAQQIQMPRDPSAYAHALYAALAQVDAWGVGAASVETPPRDDAWHAVHNRLTKACHPE